MSPAFLGGGLEGRVRRGPIFFGQGASPQGLRLGTREYVWTEALQFQAVTRIEQFIVAPVGGFEQGKWGLLYRHWDHPKVGGGKTEIAT